MNNWKIWTRHSVCQVESSYQHSSSPFTYQDALSCSKSRHRPTTSPGRKGVASARNLKSYSGHLRFDGSSGKQPTCPLWSFCLAFIQIYQVCWDALDFFCKILVHSATLIFSNYLGLPAVPALRICSGKIPSIFRQKITGHGRSSTKFATNEAGKFVQISRNDTNNCECLMWTCEKHTKTY